METGYVIYDRVEVLRCACFSADSMIPHEVEVEAEANWENTNYMCNVGVM